MIIKQIQKEIRAQGDPVRATHSQRFFKTGKGQYGYGDVFLGLTVPQMRTIAKKHAKLSLIDIQKLLKSKFHEERLIGLLVLVDQYEREFIVRDRVYKFYLSNTKHINNWDLVDVSCHKVIGAHLLTRDRKILYKLAKSNSLWERRIAIISTFAFLRHNQVNDTLKIAELLLADREDLIHKAVGWALREVGKKDQNTLEAFLTKHIDELPRTTLRYAIERFPEVLRQKYINLK